MSQNNSPNRGAVLITGCSTGMGRSTALYLDRHGYKVYAAVRKQEHADALKSQASANLTPILMDVADGPSMKKAFAFISEEVGEAGLAGLINNAGTNHPGPLECIPEDRMRQTLEVNLIGPIILLQTFMPLIRKAKGRILNVGSIGGIAPMPFFGPYNASKGAMHALTTTLRRELATLGIEAILIVPGNIRTPIWGTGQKNLGQISDMVPTEYRESFDFCMETFSRMGDAGQSPDNAAIVFGQAMMDEKPKAIYYIGKDAKQQDIAAKLFPTRFLDHILTKLTG